MSGATQDKALAPLDRLGRHTRRPVRWRWWLATTGKVLIAAGLLILAFVGYQLWGTSIEAAQAQRRLENQFEQQLASTTLPVATTTPPTTAPSDTAPPSTEPGLVQDPGTVQEGDPIAILSMPTIGVERYVVAGVGADDLKKGPGHFPATPMPGQYGNAAIAGHRTTFGAPFYDIDQLRPGDPIVVTTLFGTYTYVVEGTEIVGPADYQVVVAGDPSAATLTLVSCHPAYSAKQRIVVRSRLDEASSSPAGRATSNYVAITPDTTAPATPETLPGETPTATTIDVPPATDAAPASLSDASVDATADAFSHGWFDDSDAWAQVAFWGSLLVIVALWAWGISRTTRHQWIGALAGVVPFLVFLYFFFQNVNRLLPASI